MALSNQDQTYLYSRGVMFASGLSIAFEAQGGAILNAPDGDSIVGVCAAIALVGTRAPHPGGAPANWSVARFNEALAYVRDNVRGWWIGLYGQPPPWPSGQSGGGALPPHAG